MEDDIPPEWMWPFDKELTEWFDAIAEERKNPGTADDRIEVDMTKNEYVRE